MTLVLAILGAIPALYGIIVIFQKAFKKSNSEKAIEAITEVENALDKAKKDGNTEDLEKIFNK